MSFSIKIEPEWNIIKKIKEKIYSDPFIKEQTRDVQDSVILASIELLENALKYSTGKDDLPVLFDLNIDNKLCEIHVTNTCKDEQNIDSVLKVLKKLKTENPFDMYVQRLEELKDNPDGFSRMGLIRIVYEAEFELTANYKNDQLTMIAKCNI